MSAVYPANIKQFPVHKNTTETIDAAHINTAQDEIVAIQNVLGVTPQIDPSLNGTSNDFGTVKARLQALHRGTTIPVCSVQRAASLQNVATNSETAVIWDTAAQQDPFNMFGSGTNVTIQRDGWYVLTADLSFAANTSGSIRMMKIRVGSTEVTGNNCGPVPSLGTRLSASWSGKIVHGQTVTVTGYHNATTSLGMNASLGVTFVRDL